jgi:phage shock protein C
MTENPKLSPPYRQLRRPVDDRMIAGVCSGIARYGNLDPNAVRALFALVAVLTWGTALFAYPIMWFIMPEER